MAVKIIKEPTESKRFEATCPVCGCTFEFDLTDAKWWLSDQCKGYYSHIECNIDCPHCKTTLTDMQKRID